MKPRFWGRGVLAAAALGLGRLTGAELFPEADPKAPLLPELRAKLPESYRSVADRWLHLDPRQQRALLGVPPEELRGFVLAALAQEPGAEDFILSDLSAESRGNQIAVLGIMTLDPGWRRRPGLDRELENIGKAIADSDLAAGYLEVARRMQIARFRLLLQDRIAAARARGDDAQVDRLARQDELWMKLGKAAMLPGFIGAPPPLFSIVPADRPIRLVAMGDYGEGTPGQRRVAESIRRAAAEKAFDFGLTLGDNFYPQGMASLDDPRWRKWWEDLYGPLRIRFYAVLGNHDWYHPDSAAAEILYSQRSPSWRMPAAYYTFTAGPVQFFALDTDDIAEAEAMWLKDALDRSRAQWKVVYGHHPIFAALGPYYTAAARTRLWPLIRGRVDVYLAGHQHAMEQLKPVDGVHFWVAGGGGAHLHPILKDEPHTEMAASTFGFAVLEAGAGQLSVTLYDGDGKRLDGDTIRNRHQQKTLAARPAAG